MDQRAKKRRNLLQNIAIVLLTASAVTLFVQTQLYNLRTGTGYLSGLFPTGSVQKTQNVSGLTDLAMPVRVAVTGAYGRWADLSLTTVSEDFAQPRNLLMEALGSAGAIKDCGADDFRSALRVSADYGGSVYYDFDSALPLSLLAGLVGAGWNGGDLSARRVLLQAEGSTVQLFLWDGGSACFVCPTAVTDSSALMLALSFNPHTNSRYSESSGAEVVVEGDRTLSIRSDGEVSYQGSSGTLSIASAGETPTEAEVVVGAYQLLSQLLPAQSSAELFLQSYQSDGVSTTLRFGYQYNGLPIRFTDGGAAAEVTLESSAVTRLSLRLRQYTAGESAGTLLPLAQALSIARSYPGKELAVYYVDSGSTAAAQWLVE